MSAHIVVLLIDLVEVAPYDVRLSDLLRDDGIIKFLLMRYTSTLLVKQN